MPERSDLRLRHGDSDVAEFEAAGVVALDVEGAGFGFVGVEGSTGDAFDLLLVNGGDAVADDGEGAADQGDVKDLPGAGLARKISLGGDAAVDAADAAFRRIGG